MTPAEATATYRRQLGPFETVTLSRVGSDTTYGPVAARVMGYGPTDLVLDVQEGDRKAVLIAEDVAASGFPLPFVESQDRLDWNGALLVVKAVDDATRRLAVGEVGLEMSDAELEQQGTHAHATRNWVFLHGTAEQFAHHTERMLELEQEYLRRFPKRTWQGGSGAPREVDEATRLRLALRGLAAQISALIGESDPAQAEPAAPRRADPARDPADRGLTRPVTVRCRTPAPSSPAPPAPGRSWSGRRPAHR